MLKYKSGEVLHGAEWNQVCIDLPQLLGKGLQQTCIDRQRHLEKIVVPACVHGD